jgi:hypothetical protein
VSNTGKAGVAAAKPDRYCWRSFSQTTDGFSAQRGREGSEGAFDFVPGLPCNGQRGVWIAETLSFCPDNEPVTKPGSSLALISYSRRAESMEDSVVRFHRLSHKPSALCAKGGVEVAFCPGPRLQVGHDNMAQCEPTFECSTLYVHCNVYIIGLGECKI